MKNYLDGGEAILEAFRKLKIDYIMSSPGSEWSPLWEALARQKLDNKAGPTFVESWHETLAVNMATGYTLITGPAACRRRHAAGKHGRARRHAERSADGRHVG
jgi:acetolactate synthase I/II/III large subunit